MTYFTLLIRDGANEPWVVHFGDRDSELVMSERDDLIDGGTRRANLKIIWTSEDQALIDAEVAKLNEHVAHRVVKFTSCRIEDPDVSTVPDYSILPPHLREGMRLYLEQGVQPGSFLTLFISNDLLGALAAADKDTVAGLYEIGRFLYLEAPAESYGSAQRLLTWCGHNGQSGRAIVSRSKG